MPPLRFFDWFPRSSVGIHIGVTSGVGMRSHTRAWKERIEKMKRLGGLWPQIVSFENLLLAYRKARKG